MKKVATWGPGSHLQVGDADAGDPGIALHFRHDASSGIVLERTEHRHKRSDGKVQRFSFHHGSPTGLTGFWKAVLRPVGVNTPITVRPGEAREFEVWVDDTRRVRRAILRWSDIRPVSVATADRFWFEVLLAVDRQTHSQVFLKGRMGRLSGGTGSARVTIDEIELPIVYTRQPGDSTLARLLVPTAHNVPVPATNIPMSGWQLVNLAADLEHPARGQQMQFSALFAGDSVSQTSGSEILSPFRKILFFGTEDFEGRYKRYRHSVVSDAAGLAYYRWASVYFAHYGAFPDRNCFDAAYSSVLCGLRARDDAWWFDVTERYRKFVRTEMGLTPIRSPAYALNREAADGKSVYVATINLLDPPRGIGAVFSDYVDHALNLQQVYAAPGSGANAKIFMEWQKWLVGPTGSGMDLVGPDYNPRPFSNAVTAPLEIPKVARDQIVRAQKNGVNISVYTLPLLVNRVDWPGFDPAWLLRDRLGATQPAANGEYVDFGQPPAPKWLETIFFADVLASAPGLGGFYLDTVGGGGSFARYMTAVSIRPNTHGPSGLTTYVKGVQNMLDALRTRVSASQRNLIPAEQPFLPTEAVQEFFAGRYDAAQHGIKPLPWQTQTNILIDQFVGVSRPLPIGVANSNPPLWNAVYHEYSRAEALGMMLNTEAVSGALGGGANFPYPGITWDEWGDYNRMVHALMFVQGMKSSLFTYFHDVAAESVIQTGANGPVILNSAVPQQRQLVQFMQDMHAASARTGEAGAFVMSGAMERPLRLPMPNVIGSPPFGVVVFPPDTVDVQPSPAPPAFSRTAPLPGITRHMYEDVFTAGFPHTMMKVLHSVWRESPTSNRLGLVMVNWSDESANWQATFDPSLYEGYSKDFKVIGLEPNGAGVHAYSVGNGSGPTVLGFGGKGVGLGLIAHGQPGPGKMPPRSVQVFLIEPR